MENLLGFILASFALTGSPGPNTLSLAATGAAFGPRRSLGFMVGLLIGMVLVMAITATGAMSLFLALPGVKSAAVLLAFAYFVYLAFRIAAAPPLVEGAGELKAPSFMTGIGQSLVNPKAYAAMAALFSGFSLIRESPASMSPSRQACSSALSPWSISCGSGRARCSPAFFATRAPTAPSTLPSPPFSSPRSRWLS